MDRGGVIEADIKLQIKNEFKLKKTDHDPGLLDRVGVA